MGSVSPLLVYSPRAKNDFNFMTSHTDWPSDMYLVGACECVSFMQNNPDVCVLEDSQFRWSIRHFLRALRGDTKKR